VKRGEEGKGEGLLIIPIKLRSLWGFSRGEHHLVLQALFSRCSDPVGFA